MSNAQRKPEDLTERFFKLFTASTGVHVTVQKKNGQMKPYYTKDLLSQQCEDRENIFMTPNTSKKWSRRKANVCALSAITIDIDYYKTGMTKAQIMFRLPVVLKDEKIRYPTAIIDSGNGLYLMWKLEEQVVNNQVMVRLYEKITKTIQAKLAYIGADAQACDVLHLFRMPGTLNTKYGKRKEVFVEYLDERKMYDLEYFATEVLEELPARRQKSAQTPKSGQKQASVKRLFNPYTLALARIKDLEKLAQLREFDMNGCRHTFLNIYATHLTQAGVETYEQKLADMNTLLTNPVRETEVQAIVKTLKQKAENGARVVQAIEAQTQKTLKAKEKAKHVSYAYKTATIIRELAISETEQKNMQTLFEGDERRKRDLKRKQKVRAEIKEENKTAKERRDAQVSELASQGCTHKEIAEKLEISTKTVQRILKK